MMKTTIWKLAQRTGGWCEPVQKKNLSTFGADGESHGSTPYRAGRRGQMFHADTFPMCRLAGSCSGEAGRSIWQYGWQRGRFSLSSHTQKVFLDIRVSDGRLFVVYKLDLSFLVADISGKISDLGIGRKIKN